MCVYYKDLQLINEKYCIYTSFLNESSRYVITRWRLWNHDLKIETGRYTRPLTPREDRKCDVCNMLEDEQHAIFVCHRYELIKEEYPHLIISNSISKFLNPKFNIMIDTARFLLEIEKSRNK